MIRQPPKLTPLYSSAASDVYKRQDGQKYEIDRVIDIRPAYAAKAGGQGDRYTIQVNGARTYLYFERSTNLTGNTIGRWFVERKVPLRDIL